MNKDQAIKVLREALENIPYITCRELQGRCDLDGEQFVNRNRVMEVTASIEPEVASATVSTAEFNNLLYSVGRMFRSGSAEQLIEAGDVLVAHIDAHCAQQVAVWRERAECAITELASQMDIRAAVEAQLAQVQANSDDISSHLGAMTKIATELKAQLAARIEPATDPLVTVILGGIDGNEYDNIDVEIISSKRLEELQSQLVRTSDPVYLHLYAAPQPIAQPAPDIPDEQIIAMADRFGIDCDGSYSRTELEDRSNMIDFARALLAAQAPAGDALSDALVMLEYVLPHIPPKAIDAALARKGPMADAYVNTITRRFIAKTRAALKE